MKHKTEKVLLNLRHPEEEMDPLFDLEKSLPTDDSHVLFAEPVFEDSQMELELQNEDLEKNLSSWLTHHPETGKTSAY